MVKKRAFIFDLDSTINHSLTVSDGLIIYGRTGNSVIDKRTLLLLKEIGTHLALFVATGRSAAMVVDFKTHFSRAGVKISGWILEHGTVVEGHPEWRGKVLQGIDLPAVHEAAKVIVREHKLPIDTECYRHNHEGVLLYSGRDRLSSEYFLSQMSGVLDSDFRTFVSRRKITIIPKRGDKYFAFRDMFEREYAVAFAAGDAPDDLTLLQNASFPLCLQDSSSMVRDYIHRRGGYVSSRKGHSGIKDVLDFILCHLEDRRTQLVVPGPRLPYEEIETFRKSRCVFLDTLFLIAKYPRASPDISMANQLSEVLAFGKNTVVEVRMRDWGGEVKPLRNLLKAMVRLLPFVRFMLIFRPERLGVENLKSFSAITEKLADFVELPDGRARFSAPGVPDSPDLDSQPSINLCLYDHPEDLAPWYDLAISRLLTEHPKEENTFYINPMFLKIADLSSLFPLSADSPPAVKMCGPRVMMAANIVDQKDIRMAIEGFQELSPLLDALIIAPRVVTNPVRNQKIKEAVEALGEELFFYSRLKSGDKPKILFIDTYGDLPKLYSGCSLTYLGGGYDTRKRGFDPMESLLAGVPVFLGPVCDFNRIAVDSLKDSGWVTVLEEESEVSDFAALAKQRIVSTPSVGTLKEFLHKRKQDPMRVAVKVLKALSDEHHSSTNDRISSLSEN